MSNIRNKIDILSEVLARVTKAQKDPLAIHPPSEACSCMPDSTESTNFILQCTADGGTTFIKPNHGSCDHDCTGSCNVTFACDMNGAVTSKDTHGECMRRPGKEGVLNER